MPRDALTSTTSPSRSRGRNDVEGGLRVRHVVDPAGVEARLDRSVDDAPRVGPDDDQQLDDRAGRRADVVMPGLVGVAELEHLAEHRDPCGRAGRPAGRAPRSTEPGDAL